MTETLFGNLEQTAIERLQEFEKIALSKHPDGYYLAYSGGKDSDVILDLAKRSGVKFTAHHHLTTCDPPELVYHVRTHPDVEIHKPKETIWAMIRRKKMLPERWRRYCCDLLKERGGSDQMVITGVRWAESKKRSKRKMHEFCMRNKTKQYLHPIIDWSDDAVWEHIRKNGVDYCKLYDEGWPRLGCVMCPMTNKDKAWKEYSRWPKIGNAWKSALFSYFDASKSNYDTPDEAFSYWMSRKTKPPKTFTYWDEELDREIIVESEDSNQMMFFED